MEIIYSRVKRPLNHSDYRPVNLTKETFEKHRRLVLERVEKWNLDALMIYADREHGANYAYMTGFEPRFEESVLILHKDGSCFLLLGNENLKMCQYSFIQATAIHVPHFSLPSQPMETTKNLQELFIDAGLCNGMRIGCVGWKMFTSMLDNNDLLFDIPAFIMDTVRQINPDGILVNAASIFLHPENGLRTIMNVNEIAHYEYGAGLASHCVLQVLDQITPGKTELELAAGLAPNGQPQNVTAICATGERFTDAIVFPRNKTVVIGDKFSLTMGLRGGLSSRAAYVVSSKEELHDNVKDYLEKVAIPYYKAAVTWYEKVGLGVLGGELYRTIENVLPQKEFHWTLNPGHYTGAEEWVGSPIYLNSGIVLKSGMLLQMDIIPAVPGYGGVCAEDGIAIADTATREELRMRYPDTWNRIMNRRAYMINELHIQLKEEILPLSDLCGYLRPYLLNYDYALKKSGI